MAQLMVRNVDEAVVRELKKRAARRNHSAEQEHREILEQALLRPRRRSLAEVLAAMPDAGEDADFERRLPLSVLLHPLARVTGPLASTKSKHIACK